MTFSMIKLYAVSMLVSYLVKKKSLKADNFNRSFPVFVAFGQNQDIPDRHPVDILSFIAFLELSLKGSFNFANKSWFSLVVAP